MRYLPLLLAMGIVGCNAARDADRAPVTVFAAASLARPVAVIADSLRASEGIVVRAEFGGSLEHARKVTELGRVPDVLLLADDRVLASMVPVHLEWYVRIATSPIVVAFGPASRYADEITSENWWRVLSRSGVTIGHADSAIAPAGAHALTVLRRAASYYREPALADRLIGNASDRYVRPNASEIAALLEAGEVDYILDYEAVARQHGFRTIALPPDLSASAIYGVSIPSGAPNPSGALAFVERLLSDDGKRAFREEHVDVLRVPVAVGTNVPPAITDRVRTLTAEPAGR